MTPQFKRNLIEILNCLPDATFAIDRQGRVVAWNRVIEGMTGIKARDMLNKGNHEYALPFYGQRKPILVDLIFESNLDIEKKYKYIHREGDILVAETQAAQVRGQAVYLWAKAALIRNHQGKVVGAIESIRDITAIKATAAALKASEQKLKEQKAALQQRNVDLSDILRQVEREKQRTQADITGNVEHVLIPLIKKVRLKGEAQKNIRVLQHHLEDLVSSFGRRITEKKYHLTTREIEISAMIRDGLTGKEISQLLHISFSTVEMHRKNIRRKLRVANKKINLTSFLKEFT